MVIKIYYEKFIKERNAIIDNFKKNSIRRKPDVQTFQFTQKHVKTLQKVVEDEVRYLYEQILEKDLPWQIHIDLYLASHKYGGYFNHIDSDENHIHVSLNGDYVIDFLNDTVENDNKFRTILFHELIHATDMTILKQQQMEYDMVQNDNEYARLKWPMHLLKTYRDEGIATLCASLLSRTFHDFDNSSLFINIVMESSFSRLLGNLFYIAQYNSLRAEKIHDELGKKCYHAFSRKLLCKVLKNLGLIPQSTVDELLKPWLSDSSKVSRDMAVQVYKACLTLNLSQYIAGLLLVDEFRDECSDETENDVLPLNSLLSLCAKVQNYNDKDKTALFSLLMDITYPTAEDFVEVLDELLDESMTEDGLRQRIESLHKNPEDASFSMLDMIDKIHRFYLQHKEGPLQTYAEAARLVLNYYFSSNTVIDNHLLGFGRVDDVLLMVKLLRLLQLDVFSTCFNFERNEENQGLVVTGYKGWLDDEFPVGGLGNKDMYIPAHHEFEGEILPVVAIGDDAKLGNDRAESIIIPSTVKQIGDNAFDSLRKIRYLKVESGNPVYDSRQNCNAIIESATNTMIIGCGNTTIPYSVETIASPALEAVWGTELVIPDTVTYISDDAFAKCRVDKIYTSNPSLIGQHPRRTKVVNLYRKG